MTAVNPPAGSISFVVITENNVRDCDAILGVLNLAKKPDPRCDYSNAERLRF